MIDEEARLNTFSEWPSSSPVTPESLAKDGFYALHSCDRVKCAFCGLVLKSWERGDSVRVEHTKFSADCPLIKDQHTGNIPLVKEPPYYPLYSKEQKRRDSFKNWPTNVKQTPQSLANAGFFYTGKVYFSRYVLKVLYAQCVICYKLF